MYASYLTSAVSTLLHSHVLSSSLSFRRSIAIRQGPSAEKLRCALGLDQVH